jgi:hypothetical protein
MNLAGMGAAAAQDIYRNIFKDSELKFKGSTYDISPYRAFFFTAAISSAIGLLVVICFVDGKDEEAEEFG